jgi:hypothetical protein
MRHLVVYYQFHTIYCYESYVNRRPPLPPILILDIFCSHLIPALCVVKRERDSDLINITKINMNVFQDSIAPCLDAPGHRLETLLKKCILFGISTQKSLNCSTQAAPTVGNKPGIKKRGLTPYFHVFYNQVHMPRLMICGLKHQRD